MQKKRNVVTKNEYYNYVVGLPKYMWNEKETWDNTITFLSESYQSWWESKDRWGMLF